MNNADGERTEVLVPSRLAKRFIQPSHRRLIRAMRMRLRLVFMGMSMDEVSMDVLMGMDQCFARFIERSGEGTKKTRYVGDSEHDQHDSDRQLHAEAQPCRNGEVEQNDCRSDNEDGDGMAKSPEDANHSGAGQFRL